MVRVLGRFQTFEKNVGKMLKKIIIFYYWQKMKKIERFSVRSFYAIKKNHKEGEVENAPPPFVIGLNP